MRSSILGANLFMNSLILILILNFMGAEGFVGHMVKDFVLINDPRAFKTDLGAKNGPVGLRGLLFNL